MSMTAEKEPSDRLRDLPYSRRVVLRILSDADHPMTTGEFTEYDISQRTAQRAIHDLRQLGVVERVEPRQPKPTDKPRYGVVRQSVAARED